jgi:predicted nucleic acid-binding protein
VKLFLDTNVISEAGKNRPQTRVLNWLLAHEAACAVPSIAVAERYQGAYATEPRRPRHLMEISALVQEAGDPLLSFDAAAAEAWGEYVSRSALRRQPRFNPDTQIAAIAIGRHLTVVTRNTGDFPEVLSRLHSAAPGSETTPMKKMEFVVPSSITKKNG